MERMAQEGNIEMSQAFFMEIWNGYERSKQLEEENKNLKEDVEYFRQIYLDLKKMCEDGGYLLTDEEVTKLFNLDEIK